VYPSYSSSFLKKGRKKKERRIEPGKIHTELYSVGCEHRIEDVYWIRAEWKKSRVR
jgi:hypothetical protein